MAMRTIDQAIETLRAERKRAKKELVRLDQAIRALRKMTGPNSRGLQVRVAKARRKLSAAARKRIAAAQRARWAKVRRGKAS